MYCDKAPLRRQYLSYTNYLQGLLDQDSRHSLEHLPTTLIRVGDVNLLTFSFSGFYDYDFDLRIGTPILNFSEIFFA